MDELDRAHELLGTRPDATRDEIRRAFRDAAKQQHPDRGGDAAAFIDLRDAMTLLVERAPVDALSATAGPTGPTAEASASPLVRAAAHYARTAQRTSHHGTRTATRRRRPVESAFATVLARHLAGG